ncbi:hypothetical protein [Hymenobacter sp. GOD-10R]|uniref:hypothetical protein n=1 Tax=Hymenobacter sp. GOD-10R TaxID=3093922 RepID=UPI002D7655A7|nr:hypothetical protein [Hymenobacter sp. GOD-10R]WRQ29148.1 hypothetical protein SD425_02580 [Hymenobacter sp. GOD-10R]
MGNFSKALQKRLSQKALGHTAPEFTIPLPESRTFWAARMLQGEWWQLQPGQHIVISRKGKQEMLGFKVEKNKLAARIPFIELVALDGSWGTVLLPKEIEAIVRFEVREDADPLTAFAELLTKLVSLN